MTLYEQNMRTCYYLDRFLRLAAMSAMTRNVDSIFGDKYFVDQMIELLRVYNNETSEYMEKQGM